MQRDRHNRQDHAEKPQTRVVAKRRISGRRKPAEPNGEDRDEDERDPERREDQAEHRQDVDRTADEAPAQRTRDAERQPRRQADDQNADHQRQRDADPAVQQGRHAFAGEERDAEIAGRRSFEPMPVLHQDRLIEGQLRAQLLVLLLRPAPLHQRARKIAGGKRIKEERQECDDEDQRQGHRQPMRDQA
jgi:hypothetical protein